MNTPYGKLPGPNPTVSSSATSIEALYAPRYVPPDKNSEPGEDVPLQAGANGVAYRPSVKQESDAAPPPAPGFLQDLV